jgi:hypothetical protein
MFGGLARFGTRLDIDPLTAPDVIGDAWVPPFEKDSFDFVIMDPPYIEGFRSMSNQKTRALFAAAAWIARKQVIWFHTVWIESPTRCTLQKGYLVVVGRHCHVRCLQIFDCPASELKVPPVKTFSRGPAIRYNKWLLQPQALPLSFSGPDQT